MPKMSKSIYGHSKSLQMHQKRAWHKTEKVASRASVNTNAFWRIFFVASIGIMPPLIPLVRECPNTPNETN